MNVVILLSLYLVSCFGSPFELTEEYVKKYQDGIGLLQKEAMDYKRQPDEQLLEKYKDANHTALDPEEYDFIIIGGGTSGAVLAGRLSEVPEWKILLLEAGGDETKITKIPAVARLLRHTPRVWGYSTIPQTTWCLGKADKQCPLVMGRIMGGLSSINDMLYIRGNARDFDVWADDDGNEKWCHNDILPYFLKSENANLENFDRKYHKQGGLYYVEHPQYQSNFSKKFINAAHELNIPEVDYNGKEQMGASIPQMTTFEGERSSTSASFLEHFHPRKNLHVIPQSHVLEIIIAPHTNEAKGVKFIHEGEIKTAKAKKEVLVAAGGINSPKLLMLSGIGPKAHLQSLGIDCVKDLPVGEQLKDHPAYPVRFHYNASHTPEENVLVTYLQHGKGPLTTAGIDGIAFVKTAASKDTANYPDVMLSMKTDLPHLIQMDVMVTHPKSSGTIKLKSKDPLQMPLVDLQHLSDEDDHDLATMLEGTKLAAKLTETESFKDLEPILMPVKECKESKTAEEYWKCAIRQRAYSAGHYTGACRMGKDEKKSVVDSELRIHGVHKLRVIDGSVIPISITGGTEATVVMIAEKASDMIKEAWK